MKEYQTLYMEELDEQLQLMEEEILRYEQAGESMQGVQRLFRSAHTLKGSSAAMGYERMKRLTHNMEHILEQIRDGRRSLNRGLATLFLRCLDRMKTLRAEIDERNAEDSDIEDLVADLTAEGDAIVESPPGEDAAESRGLPEEARQAAEQWSGAGSELLLLTISLASHCQMKTARFHLIDRQLESLGTVVWSESRRWAQEGAETGQRFARWLVGLREPRLQTISMIRTWIDVEDVTLDSLDSEKSAADGEFDREANPIQRPIPAERGDKARSHSIRVSVDRLEQLMNLVGELVIDQTRIKQIEKTLGAKFGTDESVQDLGQIADHFTRIVGQLQESVMKVRMLPIEQLLNRFPRMIRDISQTLGKEVELVMEGKDTELDRTLIEELGDPLIHLLRNAVDHGIELPAARREKGKPEKGSVFVRASHEDNQVLIVVEDDGAGIDAAKLLRKAVDRKRMTPAEAEQCSEQEALSLIFEPGLSTAAQLSDISGRGVGMDIVREGIEKMNGRIDVESRSGAGTRFTIRLPLTLAIISGLMVKLAGTVFIIPMNNVLEIVRLHPKEIRSVKGVPIVTIRNQVIPVSWLHDCFGYPRSGSTHHVPLVIVGRAEKRYALAVDELLGNQEIVIKSLGSFVGHAEGIAGAPPQR
ncbi:MAG: chemotaxis protein CheA, partial [Cohnella sp.]|nr:chemotaxis protein CheA [Cohnella sp.]